MDDKAAYYIHQHIYEVGYCRYHALTTLFVDGEPRVYDREYSNVKADEVVNIALAEPVAHAESIYGAGAPFILYTNGTPYVDLNTYKCQFYEDQEEELYV